MTTIEWTDETWNPVTGCDRISPGCAHCYAKALHDMRHQAFLNGVKMPPQYSVPFETVQCHPERLEIPRHWRSPRLCFINSMADLFHEEVPFEFVAGVLYTVSSTRHVTYQALTKRADRMLEFFLSDYWKLYGTTLRWSLPNFWPGVSVESKRYLPRLDALRQVPAPVRMVSFEPLLEDLGTVNLDGIGWAILGFESGRKARPGHIAWIRSLIEQCDAAGVPVFVKQTGRYPVDWSDFIDKHWPRRTRRIGRTGLHPHSSEVGRLMCSVCQGTTLHLLDPKGGNPNEWPEELRRREFPKPYPGHQVVRLASSKKRKVAAA